MSDVTSMKDATTEFVRILEQLTSTAKTWEAMLDVQTIDPVHFANFAEAYEKLSRHILDASYAAVEIQNLLEVATPPQSRDDPAWQAVLERTKERAASLASSNPEICDCSTCQKHA